MEIDATNNQTNIGLTGDKSQYSTTGSIVVFVIVHVYFHLCKMSNKNPYIVHNISTTTCPIAQVYA
jgi:hypothetical protein